MSESRDVIIGALHSVGIMDGYNIAELIATKLKDAGYHIVTDPQLQAEAAHHQREEERKREETYTRWVDVE